MRASADGDRDTAERVKHEALEDCAIRKVRAARDRARGQAASAMLRGMRTSRVVSWCAVGCLLVSCGDSNKAITSNHVAGMGGASGTSGGKGGASGGAGTSVAGASGSGAVATGGSAGAGAMAGTAGAAGVGGAGDSSGGTGGTMGAGDAGEAGSGPDVGGSAGAAGAGGEGGAGRLGEGVEGIYTLDDVILNTGTCDPGGTNVRSAYDATHVVVRRTTVATTTGDRPALVVTGCAGLAACRALGATLVDDSTTFELSPYSLFITEEPDGTFIGTVVFYGTLDATTCRNGGIDRMSLVVDDIALTLETRTQRTDYPAVNGACSAGPAAEHGAMAPCTQLRVLTGTRVEAF
jgi:hypothetical protein